MSAPWPGPPLRPSAPPHRPPLTGRQRGTALLAGALSFPIMVSGVLVAVVPVVLRLRDAAAASILSPSAAESSQTLGDVPWPLILVVALLGIVLWGVGLVLGMLILRAGGHARVAAISWAAFALATIASVILSLIGGVALLVVGLSASGSVSGLLAGSAVAGAVAAVVVGLFVWWGMASLLRPAVARPI